MNEFLDAVRVAVCPHGRWLTESDEMGDRMCALCEVKVRTVLTEQALMVAFDQLFGEST